MQKKPVAFAAIFAVLVSALLSAPVAAQTANGNLYVPNVATVGTTTIPASGGTLVVQSTSTTGTTPVLNVLSQSGAQLAAISQNGAAGIGVAPSASATLSLAALNASTTGQIVNSAASPTADITEVQLAGSVVTRVAKDGGVSYYSQTVAQLLALAPAYVGETFYCSNCSPIKLVVSTGTAAGNFADPAGGAFK